MSSAGWRVVRSSVAGASHIEAGTVCQDSSTHELIDVSAASPVLIAAVSDGAGAGNHTDVGSQIACDSFVALVKDYLAGDGRVRDIDRTKAESWIEAIAIEIKNAAHKSERQFTEYSCTLLAAIVGEDAAAFFQIGDGAIVTSQGEDDGWTWVFWPQKGQFANETNFVIGENAASVLEFDLAPRRIDEVALFSDGLEGLVLHQVTRTVHEPFFNSVFKPVRASPAQGLDGDLSVALGDYLSSKAVCERTDDDKTLVLATRRASSVEPSAAVP